MTGSKNEAQKGLTHRTVRGMFWSTFGTIGQFGSNLIVIIVLARLLTPEDFGVFAAASIVIAFLQKVVTFGLDQLIVQPSELNENQIRTIFTVAILLGIGGVIIAFASRSLFAELFEMPELIQILPVLSLSLLIGNVGLVPNALLRRELKFRVLGMIQTASFILGYGLVAILLAFMGWGIWALVVAQIAQLLLETLLFTINHVQSLRLEINTGELRSILNTGRSMTIARVIQFFAMQGDNLVVGRWLGGEALGLYSRAYRVMSLPATLFGDAIESVLFAALAAVQDQPTRLLKAFQQTTRLLALMFIPLSALTIVLAPEIVNVMLGAQWQDAILPLQALSLGMYFRAAYKFNNSLLRAKGMLNALASLQIAYASMIIFGSLIGIGWGIAGVGIGVAVALFLYYVLSIAFVKRLITVGWADLIAMHLPAAALGVLFFGCSELVILLFRSLDVSDLVVLVLTPIFVLSLVSAAWWIAMRFGWGRDEYAALATLTKSLLTKRAIAG